MRVISYNSADALISNFSILFQNFNFSFYNRILIMKQLLVVLELFYVNAFYIVYSMRGTCFIGSDEAQFDKCGHCRMITYLLYVILTLVLG